LSRPPSSLTRAGVCVARKRVSHRHDILRFDDKSAHGHVTMRPQFGVRDFEAASTGRVTVLAEIKPGTIAALRAGTAAETGEIVGTVDDYGSTFGGSMAAATRRWLHRCDHPSDKRVSWRESLTSADSSTPRAGDTIAAHAHVVPTLIVMTFASCNRSCACSARLKRQRAVLR